MAIPLLFKLMRSGIKVPQDMSLVGFDDSTYAKQFSLTTVHQEVDFLGAEAGRLVLDLIRGQQPEVQNRVLDTYLALRLQLLLCHKSDGEVMRCHMGM